LYVLSCRTTGFGRQRKPPTYHFRATSEWIPDTYQQYHHQYGTGDIRKEGSAYDLPLAIGMLAAGEVIQPDKLNRYLMMGELSLDGSLQPIKGALPLPSKHVN
jgi:hypothetical protein